MSELATSTGPRVPIGSDQAIELRGLVKSWRGPAGPVRAVRGIDVSIARGETVALLGPNGAGKSTTIDMMLGLARPDAGSVSVFGRTPQEAVKAGLVGGMLQTGDADPRPVGARAGGDGGARCTRIRLTWTRCSSWPGSSEIAAQTTQKLSGGQTQRVRFAVAMVSNPELLVLDEPTVAMDVEGRRAFWTAMRALRGAAARPCCSPRTTSRRPTPTPTAPC